MRTFDMTPYYRSSIGFDRLFDMLDTAANRADWPPYNIERTGEDAYRITMAVAGFGQADIELTQNGNTLVVVGQRAQDEVNRQWLHQGIAARGFKQTFSLADHVRVESADLVNGLLSIDLLREVPEQLKPRRIEISSGAAAQVIPDNRDEAPHQAAKAA
ncbi:Hsp20 family protein [Chelatococcus reniformis]|uniref:Heat-shock protein Hsp20 n=1 Tax=Chelatococcus reniformis TaxID=1494448 RepID=A0A916UW62_9HYPH|nr:Hsp20 family protein [Chelatococcus reniformis]GGC90137.1 heat-shock protein Hsp20 [Chelatococcus reniformis]